MSENTSKKVKLEDILIEDPLIEPFFIGVSPLAGSGYTLYEKFKNQKGEIDHKIVCYPSTFNFALKAIGKRKFIQDAVGKFTIKQWIERWETIQKSLENITLVEA